MEIRMDVGDDRDSHSRLTLAKRAGVLAAAGVWIVSGLLLWRTEVPRLDLPALDARAYFAADLLERIHDFRTVSRVLLVATLVVELAVLAVLVWKAGPLADLLAGGLRGRIRTGVGVGVAAVLSLWLALLPLGAAAHWWRRRYGLSEQGYGAWLGDQALSLAIEALLVAAAVALVMALAARMGGAWWLAGGPALAAAGIVFILAQPLVVQPLFNRFHPLGNRALAERIEGLGARMGVRVDKVLVADASRRTTTANAYVAGLGPTKRVVFYDTILNGRFTQPELVSVSAHELAHVARSHLWKGLAWFALIVIPGTFVVAWVTERRGGLGDPAVVPLGLAVALVLSFLALPLGNAVSRRYEAEADWLALRATEDAASAVSLDRRLVTTSLGDPDPPAWSTILFGTHPPPLARIAMAEEFRVLTGRRPAREGF
jgi:STE24 endopeptidase